MDCREAALAYAAKGWPVIPLDKKNPRTPHAYKDGTTRPEQIEAWWRKWPDSWVGIVVGQSSGLCALDVDVKNGSHGDESLATLEQEYGDLPPTLSARTATGGRHFYFVFDSMAKRANKLPGLPGLEFKAYGGYMVAPPSPGYEWTSQANPSALPAWLARMSRRHALEDASSEDAPITGQNRNEHLTSLAGSMHRRGMSLETIRVALLTENTARFKPPLPVPEIDSMMRSAKDWPRNGSAPPPTSPPAPAFKGFPWIAADTLMKTDIPFPESMFQDGILSKGTYNLLAGDPGVGKSYVAMGIAIAASRGEGIFGLAGSARPRRVAYIATETHAAYVKKFYHIWKQDQPTPGLVIASPPELEPVNLLEEIQQQALVGDCSLVDLLVLDTLRRIHVGDESDPTHMSKLLYFVEKLVQQTGVCVLILHHLRKTATGDNRSNRSLHDISGTGLLGSNAKLLWLLEKHGDSQIALRCAKNNYGPEHNPVWLRRVHDGIPEVIPDPAKVAEARMTLASTMLEDAAENGVSTNEFMAASGLKSDKAARGKLKSAGGEKHGAGRSARFFLFRYLPVAGGKE